MMGTETSLDRINADGEDHAAQSSEQRTTAARWKFVLYVAGRSPKSMTALGNVQRLCDEHLQDDYEIKVVDLLVNPELAQQDQVFAVPTLVRRTPQPVKRIIGDLSDYQRTLINLDLHIRR